VLSRSTVDRQEPLRDNEDRQRELWPAAKVLLVDPHGRFPVSGDSLAFTRGSSLSESMVDGAVLLGEQDGVAYWAVPKREPVSGSLVPVPEAVAEAGKRWTDLRRSGALLDATAAGLAVTAVAVLGWHRRAPYCSGCGRLGEPARAGWARRCRGCGLEDYPRTDPAVICLVHDGADHVLLARGLDWPVGRVSVLAGFVEAGESLEACIVREVAEEVGLTVRDIHYLGSQPWPFPRSLMIAFEARADRSAPLKPADGEIAEVHWVHRDDVRAALASGSWADRTGPVQGEHPEHPELVLPGQVSIAGQMLRSWATAAPEGARSDSPQTRSFEPPLDINRPEFRQTAAAWDVVSDK
jgi:NAD+ diphosphatase